jgi:CspA family cold shock protein
VPTGKVKWFDEKRGFGFIAGDEGTEVFLHATSLPDDAQAPRPGARVEYGVGEGKRGPQALSVVVLDAPAAAPRAPRKPVEDMIVIIEDVIKLLEQVSDDSLRRGRYPDRKVAAQTAQVLRAVAADFEA